MPKCEICSKEIQELNEFAEKQMCSVECLTEYLKRKVEKEK